MWWAVSLSWCLTLRTGSDGREVRWEASGIGVRAMGCRWDRAGQAARPGQSQKREEPGARAVSWSEVAGETVGFNWQPWLCLAFCLSPFTYSPLWELRWVMEFSIQGSWFAENQNIWHLVETDVRDMRWGTINLGQFKDTLSSRTFESPRIKNDAVREHVDCKMGKRGRQISEASLKT